MDIPSPFYRVSLKAVIFDDQNRLLVVRIDDGHWEMPGGGWEHGESFDEGGSLPRNWAPRWSR